MQKGMLKIGLFLIMLGIVTLSVFVIDTGKALSEIAAIKSDDSETFTIIVLPDTQNYTEFFPGLSIYEQQTKWIAQNKDKKNIVFVTHLGDIVNTPTSEEQWRIADNAMKTLDGNIPYGIAPGNHDLLQNGSSDLYNKYFPLARLRYSGNQVFGYPNDDVTTINSSIKNSYRLLTAGNKQYIAFNLEFCPPHDVLDWTNDILKKYAERKAIITTHSFIGATGDRQVDTSCMDFNSEGSNSGEGIWDELVVKGQNNNIFLFLSGHDIWTENGGARRTDWVDGKPIHQLLSDYQHLGQGGDGYLRIMTFNPAEDTIKVETYSPYLDSYRTDPANQFTLTADI